MVDPQALAWHTLSASLPSHPLPPPTPGFWLSCHTSLLEAALGSITDIFLGGGKEESFLE